MSEYLNEYFCQMIDIIYHHGGDVIKFGKSDRNQLSRALF